MQTPKKTTPLRPDLRAKAVLPIEPPPPLSLDQHAITEGRKPLVSRREDVAEIRARALQLYGVPAAGLPPIAAIDNGFRFSPLESDAEFHYLQVESLLDQAAALLDRCADTRTLHRELQLEKWTFAIELDRFLRLDQVAEQELAAGRDSMSYERAVRENAAEASIEFNHKSAEEELKGSPKSCSRLV